MSTTCTACGPLKLPQEALLGQSNPLVFFLFVGFLVFWLHSSFYRLSFNLPPFNILSVYHPIPFCGCIHHLSRLLGNQSSLCCCCPTAESQKDEGKYHIRGSRFHTLKVKWFKFKIFLIKMDSVSAVCICLVCYFVWYINMIMLCCLGLSLPSFMFFSIVFTEKYPEPPWIWATENGNW